MTLLGRQRGQSSYASSSTESLPNQIPFPSDWTLRPAIHQEEDQDHPPPPPSPFSRDRRRREVDEEGSIELVELPGDEAARITR